jgi:DNA-binding NarL/FixJ family response regulator
VLIADDHTLFREGVAALIERHDGFVLAGEAGDGEAAVEQAMVLKPDVAVIDIAMPLMGGIEAARRISRSPLATQSVILSPRPDEASQKQALEAGALGFLAKACSFEDLARAIRDVVRGDYHLTHPAGDPDPETIRKISNGHPAGGIITPREREIAVLLTDGYSTKEAAAVLGISPRTAEAHRAAVMRKLGARNVADIVKYCIRNHLVDM